MDVVDVVDVVDGVDVVDLVDAVGGAHERSCLAIARHDSVDWVDRKLVFVRG